MKKITLKNIPLKVSGYNLQEMLIVLAIIGILLLIAMPMLTPLIGKAKSIEAQMQLKALYHSEQTYKYIHSKYTINLNDIDFEKPKSIHDGGTSNYKYEILEADQNTFRAIATAVVDFDGDGILNTWEITQEGQIKQLVKD